MGTKGRKQHNWTEQDQQTMLLNPELTSEKLAQIIGCATSCVATHRLRYKAIRDEQDRLAALRIEDALRTRLSTLEKAAGEVLLRIRGTFYTDSINSEGAVDALAALLAEKGSKG